MGWRVSHNKDGYQIISTNTNERIHEKERLTKEETKTLMVEVALYEFFEKLIKIDKDFLFQFSVNGKRQFGENEHSSHTALKWIMDNEEQIPTEASAILKRLLNIEIVENEK